MSTPSSPHSAGAAAASQGWTIEADRVILGDRISLAFHRTLRVPEDDRDYPLPPGLGRLPVHRVEDHERRLPRGWRKHDAVFVPLYQREALWLGFDGRSWHPNVLTIAAGGINVITGQPATETLSSDPQDYLVVPDQPWLDGFHLEAGVVRQFVAAPLGWSATVAEQLGAEDECALEFRVFDAVPGRFPEQPPPESNRILEGAPMAMVAGLEMGFAAGGRITQKLYTDEYGFESWRPEVVADLIAYVANSELYEEITGRPAPPTPITAKDYTDAGLPWFELYDENRSSVATGNWLRRLRTLGQVDPEAATKPVSIPTGQVRRTKPR
jgi:hypothetical protein